MDVVDFCKGIEMELTAWKAKLYDAMRKVDKMPGADKEKMLPNIEDLHIIIAELDERIHELRTECPSEWGPQKAEIDNAQKNMRLKYEDLMKLLANVGRVAGLA